ncbi:OpgC domain-containing protein [Trinickia mobilis]|uniref:OpgC domain-containing protein n=1 Tax=Trinickia mobilis TaxID=2816356 RepID=UPI001A8CC862|nr:OpgC domain-containing protein [Trinickia mobilis]
MNSPVRRSLEIDFFRGLVLIVIAIDHIPGSVLSHVMLHSYAYCDAAEVFVFLGGYASAAAYTGIEAHRGKPAANRRFLRRAWEIYRAYLLTALLILLSGAALTRLRVDSPFLADTGWARFLHHPLGLLADVALLKQQPYLSAVLPMYVCFALSVPAIVPLAERTPSTVLFASLALWFCGPWLAGALPAPADGGWAFNPVAWQLMFVFGVLCRVHPASNAFQASRTGQWLTALALVVALTLAFIKLFVDTQPAPGYMKQNLASLRIVSFVAVAWLAAQAVRLQWVRTLAERLPGVVMAGRQGVVCFVGGAVVSIAVDAATRLAHGLALWPFRLLGDIAAIGLLLALAKLAHDRKAPRARSAPLRPAAVPARAVGDERSGRGER